MKQIHRQKNRVGMAIFFMGMVFVKFFWAGCGSQEIKEKKEMKTLFHLSNTASLVPYFEGKLSFEKANLDSLYQGDFSILEAGPKGILKEKNGQNFFYIVFSKPVVKENAIGKSLLKQPFITLSPAVEGSFCWIGNNCLIFQPKDSFFRDGNYRVQVNGTLKDLSGTPLGSDFSFHFFPRPFQITDFWSGTTDSFLNNFLRKRKGVALKELRHLYIETLYPLPVKELKSLLEVKQGVDLIPYRLKAVKSGLEERGQAVYRIRLKKKVSEGAKLQLFFDHHPMEGRNLFVHDVFKVVDCYLDCDYLRLFYYPDRPTVQYLNMELTAPVKRDSLKNRVFINEQPVPLELLESQGNRIVYRGVLNPSGEYNRVVIKAGVVDCYNRQMESSYQGNVKVSSFIPYLFSAYRKVNFVPFDFPFLELEGWNFPKGRWELYRETGKGVSPDFLLPFQFEATHYPYQVKSSLQEFLEKEKMTSFYAKVNYEEEARQPEENSNTAGIFSPFQEGELSFFQIARSGITVALSKEDLFIYVTNLSDSTPIENGELTLVYKEQELSLYTNEAGWVLFQSPFGLKNVKNHPFLIKFNREGESLLFPIDMRHRESETVSAGGFPYLRRALLISDRKQYQKGESVNLLVMDPYVAKEQKERVYSLSLQRLYPHPRRFQTRRRSLPQTGISPISYPLSEGIGAGQYLLSYKTEETIATFAFEVGESPSRQLLQLERSDYICSQRIQATLSAQTEEGEPAINTENNLLIRQSFYPFPSEQIPFKQGFVGPLADRTESRTFTRQLYSDNKGKSYFLLDTMEFYQGNVLRLPSRLELTPTFMDQGKEMYGVSKSIHLSPSQFLIAARLVGGTSDCAADVNKKFYLEYQLIRPDGEFAEARLNRKKLFLEISPLGKEGERLGMTGRLSRGGSSTKGKFSLKIYKAGRYLITLRSEDQLGNPVITELPLFILGENSQSDYIQMSSLHSVQSIQDRAIVWVNLPKSVGVRKGEKMILLKSSDHIQEPMTVQLQPGSQLLEIPLSKKDYPHVRFSLIGHRSPLNQPKERRQKDSLFAYSTILASCSLEIKTPSVLLPPIEVEKVTNAIAQQSGTVEFSVGNASNEKGNGLLFSGFLPQQTWDKEVALLQDHFHALGHLPVENLSFHDSRSLMQGSQVENSGLTRWHYWDEQSFCSLDGVALGESLAFQSNQKQTLSLSFPQKAGDYQLFLCGLWEGIPFFKNYPLSIADEGRPDLEVDFPKKLRERDFVLGEIKMPSVAEGEKSIELNIELLQGDRRWSAQELLTHEGLSLHQSKLMLSKNSHWQTKLGVSAKAPGKYRIRFSYLVGEKQKSLDFPIEVVSATNRQTLEWQQKGIGSFFLEPIVHPFHRQATFKPILKVQFASSAKMNWGFLLDSLMKGKAGELLDGRISALFPYYQVKGGFPYNRGLKMLSDSEAQQILDLLVSLQNSNGGYPVCIDKNYESDFYTTLRVADLLEFSGLSYYDYTVVWSLTQYMKLAFKGNNKDRDSYYLRCYAAWIIARYGENIVLNGKNLIEEDKGSLAEIALAAMAVLQSGKKHRIDVSDYLEQPLSRMLRLYDPDLKEATLQTERESFISYQGKNLKGAFGYDRPRNGAVEDALVFLFLEQEGSHRREAQYAIERMLQKDLKQLNSLDASFVMRAFYLAHRKGYLKKLYPDLENQKGVGQLIWGEKRLLSGEYSGYQTFQNLLDVSFLQKPKRKQNWVLQIDEGMDSLIEAQFSFDLPGELSREYRFGYSLLENWQDLSGEKMDRLQFKPGKWYQYRLFLSGGCGKGPFKLFIPFPSEIFYLESVITLSGDIYQENSVKKEELEEGIVLNYLDFPREIDEILLTFKPLYEGIFPKEPTTLQNYFDNRLQAKSAGALIVVKE